ncbi:MAG: hypothetical protein QXO65_02740 [Candidatus Aenigmatarchaeota archaeon]
MKGSLEFEQRMIFGIILFILIAAILLRVSTSPECDMYANETAKELRDAINEVASDNFPSWNQNFPPSDENKDFYKPVIIKLCEKKIGWAGAALSAAIPTYQIFYESFPEAPAWAAWDESYPFSGGAANALLNYAIIKYGPKIGKGIGKGIKATYKIGTKVAKYGFKEVYKTSKLNNFFNKVKTEGFIKAVLKKPEIEEKSIKEAFEKFLSQDYKQAARQGDHIIFQKALMEQEQNIEIYKAGGTIENALVDTPEGKKFIITRENINAYKLIYDSANSETQKILDKYFYVPSKFQKIENFKWKIFNVKQTIGKLWRGSFLGKTTSTLKEKYYNFKKSVYKAFGRDISNLEAAKTAEIYKVRCYADPEWCRKLLIESWDDADIGTVMSQIAKHKVEKGKFTDAEMFKFMEEHEKWIRINEEVETIISYDKANDVNMRIKDLFKEADTIRTDEEYEALMNKLDKIEKPDDKFISELQDTTFKGYSQQEIKEILIITDAEIKKIHAEKVAASGKITSPEFPGPILWRDNPLRYALNDISSNGITTKDNWNNLYTTFSTKEEISTFFAKRIVENEDQLKNLIEKKAKGYFFVKLGRVYPTLLFTKPGAPLIPGGAYFSRIVEDELNKYCTSGAICFTLGPNVYSYPLNEKATKYAIRLWRPNPSVEQRQPIFIQTGWFYPSIEEHPRFYTVSPCFGYAKVWKSGQNIFISFDVDPTTGQTKKCKVLDEKGNEKDVANYCYASFNDVWGSNYNNLEIGTGTAWLSDGAIAAHIIGIFVGCAASTVGYQQCVQIATLADEGALSVAATTAAYSGDKDWGYWTYYKASDAIDLLDIAGSLGSKGAVKAITTAQKYLPDLSVYVQALGDAAMGWPKRGLDKVKPLNEDDIYRSLGQCIWSSE